MKTKGIEDKVEVVRKEDTRQVPSRFSSHTLLAGGTIEVHKPPFWIPARVVHVSSDCKLSFILMLQHNH